MPTEGTGMKPNANPVRGPEVLEHRGLRLDVSSRTAFLGRREIALTLSEALILELLLSQPGRAFTRGELAAASLRRGVQPQRINQHVKNLRAKLGWSAIRTIPYYGYALEESGPPLAPPEVPARRMTRDGRKE
jgi:DNA-binding response OmpR family regulator